MNVKARRIKKQVNVENQAINLLSKEELSKKIEVVGKLKFPGTLRNHKIDTNEFVKKVLTQNYTLYSIDNWSRKEWA